MTATDPVGAAWAAEGDEAEGVMSGPARCASILMLALLACGDSRQAGPPASSDGTAVAELVTTIGVLGVSDAVRARELPDSLPAFVGVHIGDDGRIWVEQWPPRAGVRRFDVLTPNGELEESVEFSAPLLREPPPWFTRDAIYGVVQDTASGIERVVKLAIRRTGG